MNFFPVILQISGLLILIVAAFLVTPVAGLVVLGAALLLVGHLLDTPVKGHDAS